MPVSRRAVLVVSAVALWLGAVVSAQGPPSPSKTVGPLPSLRLETGREIFEAACSGCHGPGGTGQPQSTLGFEPPATFPDFSDCNGSTREKTYDWRSVIHEGGPGRGFSDIMPSFGEALTLDQIDTVMAYMREQCADPAWPLGELNFPRALVTEKAFPEDEWLMISSINATGEAAVSHRVFYEKRFGARNQLEFAVPMGYQSGTGAWVGGVGDVVAGYKRTIATRGPRSILAGQVELALPTGNEAKGLGSGTALLEAFALYGQALPRATFVQAQSGFELPTDTEKAPRAAFARIAFGKTFAAGGGFGRSWSPMLEVLADREFETGAGMNWDVVPEVQVTLNRRQHVRVNIGIRRPLTNADERPTQLLFYGLWDFFDGGLRDGW